jgi:hypothetical protein
MIAQETGNYHSLSYRILPLLISLYSFGKITLTFPEVFLNNKQTPL